MRDTSGVRVPRTVERLIDSGGVLQADEGRALERHLEQRREDPNVRARLLGYHQARLRKAYEGMTPRQMSARPHPGRPRRPLSAARARHTVWLTARRTSCSRSRLLELPQDTTQIP